MPYGIKQFFDIAYIIQCLTMSRNQPLTCSLLQGDKNRCFCDCNVMLSTTTINIWIKKKKTAATYIGTLKPGLVEQALLLWGTVISFSFSFFCFIWLRFTSMPVFFFFFPYYVGEFYQKVVKLSNNINCYLWPFSNNFWAG